MRQVGRWKSCRSGAFAPAKRRQGCIRSSSKRYRQSLLPSASLMLEMEMVRRVRACESHAGMDLSDCGGFLSRGELVPWIGAITWQQGLQFGCRGGMRVVGVVNNRIEGDYTDRGRWGDECEGMCTCVLMEKRTGGGVAREGLLAYCCPRKGVTVTKTVSPLLLPGTRVI